METRVRPQRERPLPDVDAEEELELSRYWNALLTRWWLPVAGLAAGSLTGHVSTQAVAGVAAALGRVGQNPLVNIVVTGKRRAQIARAADELARIVVNQVSGRYVATKIKNLQANITAGKTELDSVNARIASLQAEVQNGGLSTVERLLFANQIGLAVQEQRQVTEDLSQNQQLLALAQNVERSQLISPAHATKTTARSRRNSVLVGGLIGLLLGIIAALLWEPAARVARRTSV